MSQTMGTISILALGIQINYYSQCNLVETLYGVTKLLHELLILNTAIYQNDESKHCARKLRAG
jgi:hypothetical protein